MTCRQPRQPEGTFTLKFSEALTEHLYPDSVPVEKALSRETPARHDYLGR